MQGALNFAITNTIGAFLVLSGIALVYGRTGALNMAQIGRALATQADGLVITAMVFIMAGFLVKAAVFPFHFWLADAHAVAPTPVCILFSGVMVELGLYAVIRVYWSVMDTAFRAYRPDLEALLLGAGAATAVLGAIMCFGQRHIKRLLAFSTVSHMGLLTIGFALLAPDALAGAALYVVGHGLVKAALFMLAGILLHWLDSVDELELRGRARHLRGSGVLFLLAGLGLAGMPPFATFTGESLIEETASHQGYSWLAGVFFVAAVLTAGAVFRFAGRVFLGWGENFGGLETGKKIRGARETEPSGRVPLAMSFPVLVLVILALAAGIAVPLRQGTRRAAEEFERPAAYQARVLDQVWVPQSPAPPEAGPTNASLVRALAATACALGLAWFALSRYWPTRAGAGWAAGPMRALRSLHSGHIGDYVTFLTFGVAAFGLALALLIRLR
jgi:multicomponent Na+:H+ antiporter subunit D